MINTLKKKFIKTAMAAITLLLVVLIAALNLTNYVVQERQSQELLTMLSESHGDFRNLPPPRQPKGFLDKPLDREDAMAQRYFFVRYSREKVVDINLSNINTVDEEEALKIAGEVKLSGEKKGRYGDLLFLQRVVEGPQGEETVIIFLDNGFQNQSILIVLTISVFSGIGCWLMMLVVVILLSRSAIAPIAQNMEKQKQFVTNAGHEIKTPLAIILSNAEAMELYNGENKWIKNIKDQISRLNGLMQNLLTLSRMDEEGVNLPMTDFSFKELVEDTVDMYETAAEERGIAINKNFEEVSLKGNRDSLRQLVSVLMDNAVKYSAEGSAIDVVLSKAGKNALLSIENIAAGPLTENPQELFQRFYRGDSARTQRTGGYGIGLSSAKSIAELHKGRIEAKYKDGNRIVFAVKL